MKVMSKYRILAILVSAIFIYGACTKETANVKLTPALSSTQTQNVKSDAATVTGFVVAEGDGFTEKGVVYSTTPAPTVSNSKVAYTGTATTAAYNVTLTGLAYATKYYARAYATSASGTIYGDELNFTTLPVVPVLTTAAITVITGNSATGGGNVTVGGGADVTARGIVFGLNHNPTTADTKTSDLKGTGAFVSLLPRFVRCYKYGHERTAHNKPGSRKSEP